MSCSPPRLVAAVSPPITVTLVGVAQVGGCSGAAVVGLMGRYAVCLRLFWAPLRLIPTRTLALACFISPPEAVSYTHLDVYKRQTQLGGIGLIISGATLIVDNLKGFIEAIRTGDWSGVDMIEVVAGALMTVSYTHLDVYKRQVEEL